MSTETFFTFGLAVLQSMLMKCLLIVIETSGRPLCFLPIQERRKPQSIFRIPENTHHIFIPRTYQKLVRSEPTIHFKVDSMTWKLDLLVVSSSTARFGRVDFRQKCRRTHMICNMISDLLQHPQFHLLYGGNRHALLIKC